MDLHDGEVHGISGRESRIPQGNFLGTLRCREINRKDSIYHVQDCVECGLDGIPALNRSISMQNLLENLGIRDESLTFTDEFFE